MSHAARLALAFAGLAAAPAFASIPVDLEERSRAGLLHVCVDVEPTAPSYIVCDEQDGVTTEYTGSECTAAGLPASCRVDFVGKLRLKGKLLLIQDDQAKNEAKTAIPATEVSTGTACDRSIVGQVAWARARSSRPMSSRLSLGKVKAVSASFVKTIESARSRRNASAKSFQ